MLTISQLVKACHDYAKRQGFWNASQNIGEKLMLIVTELAEAMEAYRGGSIYVPMEDETRDQFLARRNNFEEELADTVIRICDLAGFLKVDLEDAIAKKMAHNETRAYMHGKVV